MEYLDQILHYVLRNGDEGLPSIIFASQGPSQPLNLMV